MQSKGLSRQPEEDPFDSLTDKIPERPVTVAEGASYSLVILAGLAVAGAAAYAVFKELIFEPKEYVSLSIKFVNVVYYLCNRCKERLSIFFQLCGAIVASRNTQK